MDSNFYIPILVTISAILRIAYHFKLKKQSPQDITTLQKFIFYTSILLCVVGLIMITRELLFV